MRDNNKSGGVERASKLFGVTAMPRCQLRQLVRLVDDYFRVHLDNLSKSLLGKNNDTKQISFRKVLQVKT